jgi:hypothetical protein
MLSGWDETIKHIGYFAFLLLGPNGANATPRLPQIFMRPYAVSDA